MSKVDYDVIVVGAGTSGMMAGIHAAMNGARVLVIEKNQKPGRKLILTGGGRCNVTNRSSRDDLIAHIPGNGKFLYSTLDQFNQEDIMHFFIDRGIPLKEKDHGRMFPVTDSARTIRDCLVAELSHLQVDLRLDDPVAQINYDHVHKHVSGLTTRRGQTITAHSVILAVGGMAYPRTGSQGDGYQWAEAAGHTLTDFYPTESPLLSNDSFIQDKTLQGISLRDVAVTLWDNYDKAIVTHRMDMIFTHFGYSGPAILRCSGHVNQFLMHNQATTAHLTIDLVPDRSQSDLMEEADAQRNKQLGTLLKPYLPEKLSHLIHQQVNIPIGSAYKQIDHQQVTDLWRRIKAFPITSYGSQPIAKGFVTGGGVHLKEIVPQTLQSKLMAGLFFCGEILDINGYTGGYNITAAFTTGAVAGQHAAWHSLARQ